MCILTVDVRLSCSGVAFAARLQVLLAVFGIQCMIVCLTNAVVMPQQIMLRK